jgi:hypothetical protein
MSSPWLPSELWTLRGLPAELVTDIREGMADTEEGARYHLDTVRGVFRRARDSPLLEHTAAVEIIDDALDEISSPRFLEYFIIGKIDRLGIEPDEDDYRMFYRDFTYHLVDRVHTLIAQLGLFLEPRP